MSIVNAEAASSRRQLLIVWSGTQSLGCKLGSGCSAWWCMFLQGFVLFGRRSRSGHHRRRAVGCIRRVPSDQSRAPKNLENLMQLGACQAPPCIHLAPTPLVGNPLATDVHRLDRGRRAVLHQRCQTSFPKGRPKKAGQVLIFSTFGASCHRLRRRFFTADKKTPKETHPPTFANGRLRHIAHGHFMSNAGD